MTIATESNKIVKFVFYDLIVWDYMRNFDRNLFASGYSASVTGLHKYFPFQGSWNVRSSYYHSLYKTQFLKFKPY
jgi:hypothetical protein